MKSMDFESRRVQLYGLLGDLPPRDLPITSELLWEKDCEKYILQKMIIIINILIHVLLIKPFCLILFVINIHLITMKKSVKLNRVSLIIKVRRRIVVNIIQDINIFFF